MNLATLFRNVDIADEVDALGVTRIPINAHTCALVRIPTSGHEMVILTGPTIGTPRVIL